MRSSHSFDQAPSVSAPRSVFDLSHTLKTTFDAGWLIPVGVYEALPGDTWNLSMMNFCRLATPLKPVMENIYLETQWFAVPLRLIWDNFERFMGDQPNPGDSIDFEVPQMVSPDPGAYGGSSIFDYMGLPVSVPGLTHSSLPLRAYSLIWNEWFRDENLQDRVTVDKDDGPDEPNDYALKKRGKRKDYYTSALPFPQKGPSVTVPLGISAPVISDAATDGIPTFFQNSVGDHSLIGFPSDTSAFYNKQTTANGPLSWDLTKLATDLGNATSATVNEWRIAFQIQRLFERDARGGTRYTEILLNHFGVRSPDQRLQRPEFLSQTSQKINVHPVAQTGEGISQTPQGNLAAFATSSHNGRGFVKSFVEHSIIIGVASVRADLTYQFGLDRMWSRLTKEDFYWPVFAGLGEEPILNKEIYAQGTDDPTADADVFGYQARYDSYRYQNNKITGEFRSIDPQSLDIWHLAQDFQTLPVLGDSFIQEDPPLARIMAVPAEPHLLFDSFIQIRCARPIPTFGVPGKIDHF